VITWLNGWRGFVTEGLGGSYADEVFWLMYKLVQKETLDKL